MTPCRLATAAACLVSLALAAARAADVPVAGKKLVIERGPSRESVVLVLEGAGITVPPPGSPDDPTTVAPLRVQLYGGGAVPDGVEYVVPTGLGRGAWTVQPGVHDRYANGDAAPGPTPVRAVRLREGKIEVVARMAGLALTGARGSVGVRIEVGGTRLCALFIGEAVRRDAPGKFVGREAPASTLVDCNDEALYGVPCTAGFLCGGLCSGGARCGGIPGFGGCTCISPDQPCGDTAPVCNGECPAGEACANVGGVPFPTCGCLPVGSTGCGTAYPTCGDGDCPPGLSCFATTFTCCGGVTIAGCSCLSEPPPPPCGGCPPGWTCVGPGPGIPMPFCLPPFCSGGAPAPACGGACVAPATCRSFGGLCLCLESCSGGSPFPTCGGTCTLQGTSCQALPDVGDCVCV